MKKVYNFLHDVLIGAKLRYKLLLSYVLFILVPLGFFSVLSYNSFSNQIINNIYFSEQKNFSQTFSYISEKLNKVKKTSEIIMMDDNVNDIFSMDEKNYSTLENNIHIGNSMNLLSSVEDEEDIYKVILYISIGNSFSVPSYNFYSLKEGQNQMWYKTLKANKASLLWCTADYIKPINENLDFSGQVPILSLIREIKDPSDYSKAVGFVRVDFRENSISNIVKNGDAIKGSLTYIQNSKGVPVTVSNKELYKKNNIPLAELAKDSDKVMTWTRFNGKKELYITKQFANTDWKLVTVIPYEDIITQAKINQNQIVILILIISSIGFIFAWYVAFSMTKRISLLQTKMKQVEKGQMNSLIVTSARDEIGDLTRSYNYMLKEISKLIEERYEAGIEVKSSELRALQAQINPHFLYNTLDMINWLAQKNMTEEVEQAVTSLAMFYKLSLSKGKDEITIGDELKHISYYVQIQNMRFLNRIQLIIEVDEEIKKYAILKLTLQPIIENAILHGIMNKSGKEGCIIIESIIEEGVIVIRIEDDGIGMKDEVITKIQTSGFEERPYDGFGVKNVIDRIKLFYGEQYGLKYNSIFGQGTSVEIRIPAKYII